MAIYHLNASIHSRGQGHSAVNGAAYLARGALIDERTGMRHDYSSKAHECLFEGIYAPKGAPEWARSRSQLWNHVEAFETHSKAQLARGFNIALPHELTLEQNRYVLQDWVRENFTRHGYIADVAIHAAHPEEDRRNRNVHFAPDPRNIHAHVMVPMRPLDAAEFASKKPRFESFAERDAELIRLRASWERIVNRHLVRYGFEPALDHRSLEDQGIDRAATVHLGKEATRLERNGDLTDRGDLNRAAAEYNAIVERTRPGELREAKLMAMAERAFAMYDRDSYDTEWMERLEKAAIEKDIEKEKAARREASRAAWVAERQVEREAARPPSAIENRIAECADLARHGGASFVRDREGKRMSEAEILADKLDGWRAEIDARRTGEPNTYEPKGEAVTVHGRGAFDARLAEAGISIVRVTDADTLALDTLRRDEYMQRFAAETNREAYKGNRFAEVEAGELAAVTRNGDVYRINPEKLGDAARMLPENLPSVTEARAGFAVERETTDKLWEHWRGERASDRETVATEREERADDAHDRRAERAEALDIETSFDRAARSVTRAAESLGKLAERFLSGVASFFVSEPKDTKQQAHQKAQARGNVETEHAKAVAEFLRAFEAEYDERQEAEKKAQQEKKLDQTMGRAQDDDGGRERER